MEEIKKLIQEYRNLSAKEEDIVAAGKISDKIWQAIVGDELPSCLKIHLGKPESKDPDPAILDYLMQLRVKFKDTIQTILLEL